MIKVMSKVRTFGHYVHCASQDWARTPIIALQSYDLSSREVGQHFMEVAGVSITPTKDTLIGVCEVMQGLKG